MGKRISQGFSQKVKTEQTRRLYDKIKSLIEYDRMERGGIDNVMDLSLGEHLATFKILGRKLIKNVKKSDHTVDFIDVGTGSGFWAILVADILRNDTDQYNILAVDKVKRCVEKCKENEKKANVKIDIKHRSYNEGIVKNKCTANIFMNPPYHIYPKKIHKSIPHHARGGSLGQGVFKEWVRVSESHLDQSGYIYFHHMCLGDNHPNYVNFMTERICGSPSIYYCNILEPIESDYFLKKIYGSLFPSFVDKVSDKFEFIFYTSGVLVKDDMGVIKQNDVGSDTRGLTSWSERIRLHKNINDIFVN